MLDIYFISAGLYNVNMFALPSSSKKIKKSLVHKNTCLINKIEYHSCSQTGKFNEEMLLLLENYLRPFKMLIA